MKIKIRTLTLLVAAVVVAVTGAVLPLKPAAAVSAGTCQTVTIKARLAPLLPKNLDIVGDLCLPNTWAEGERKVDVLVHGGTYNRTYWDFPVSYPNYSYVDRALATGRATFAYDRLGVGDSSRPLSLLVTLQSDAYILHQVIDWVKVHPVGFDKVTVVGHSIGSFTVLEEAGTYNDADAVVITGLLHTIEPSGLSIFTSMMPAPLDPQFAGQGYDPGYVTTAAGQRGIFYGGATVQTVIAYDEAHKDVVPLTAIATATPLLAPPLLNKSTQITSDVLVVVGDNDSIFCGLLVDCTNPSAVLTAEAPYYANAASLDAKTVTNTGHNLALHPSASASFNAISQWIHSH